jgi:hypothetical protein
MQILVAIGAIGCVNSFALYGSIYYGDLVLNNNFVKSE